MNYLQLAKRLTRDQGRKLMVTDAEKVERYEEILAKTCIICVCCGCYYESDEQSELFIDESRCLHCDPIEPDNREE